MCVVCILKCGWKMNYKDKIGTGRDENRVMLHKVVPLKIPFSIGITVSDFCNFKCIYCNHAVPGALKNQKILSLDDFVFIADKIQKFYEDVNSEEPTKVLRLWGYGEPLLNKELPKMISHAKRSNLSKRIEITTNGSLLTHDISDAMIEAGLTRLIVSIQGMSPEKYESVCGYSIDYPRLLDELEYFYKKKKTCRVFIKTVDVAMKNKDEENMFYQTFGPFCDEMGIEHIFAAFDGVNYDDILPEFDGTTRYHYKYNKKLCCDSLFSLMNIQTNGNIDCCGCKYPPLPIGNIYKNSLSDIWNGKIHRKYMKLHLSKKYQEISCCMNCASMQYNGHPADNLDRHLNEIIKRIPI